MKRKIILLRFFSFFLMCSLAHVLAHSYTDIDSDTESLREQIPPKLLDTLLKIKEYKTKINQALSKDERLSFIMLFEDLYKTFLKSAPLMEPYLSNRNNRSFDSLGLFLSQTIVYIHKCKTALPGYKMDLSRLNRTAHKDLLRQKYPRFSFICDLLFQAADLMSQQDLSIQDDNDLSILCTGNRDAAALFATFQIQKACRSLDHQFDKLSAKNDQVCVPIKNKQETALESHELKFLSVDKKKTHTSTPEPDPSQRAFSPFIALEHPLIQEKEKQYNKHHDWSQKGEEAATEKPLPFSSHSVQNYFSKDETKDVTIQDEAKNKAAEKTGGLKGLARSSSTEHEASIGIQNDDLNPASEPNHTNLTETSSLPSHATLDKTLTKDTLSSEGLSENTQIQNWIHDLSSFVLHGNDTSLFDNQKVEDVLLGLTQLTKTLHDKNMIQQIQQLIQTIERKLIQLNLTHQSKDPIFMRALKSSEQTDFHQSQFQTINHPTD